MDILLYGEFQQIPYFYESVVNIRNELISKGYNFSNKKNTLRIYPLNENIQLNEFHGVGGMWKPNTLYIRPNPLLPYNVNTFLRHEMMHEANYQTCKGTLPIWVDEASAIYFSGEYKYVEIEKLDSSEFNDLNFDIKYDIPLKKSSRNALIYLIKKHGWTQENICKIPNTFYQLLNQKENVENGAFSWRIIHLVTGKIVSSSGDQKEKAPLGSLLKIPLYSSFNYEKLNNSQKKELSDALLRSDTNEIIKLNNKYHLYNKQKYLNIIHNKFYPLNFNDMEDVLNYSILNKWQLGERKSDGSYFHALSLTQASWLMRNSILIGGNHIFQNLVDNGQKENSTLNKVNKELKNLLLKERILSKTGSTSNAQFKPYYGHVLYVWPKDNPQYLAIFRQQGVNGFKVAEKSYSFLNNFIQNHVTKDNKYTPGIVKVDLYSRLLKKDIKISSDCSTYFTNWYKNKTLFSLCGSFNLEDSFRVGKNKMVLGGIERVDEKILLLTDPLSYTNAVNIAEDDKIRGEARSAFRSIIYWNSIYSDKRNPICDTTKCMVYLGNSSSDLLNINRLKKEESIDYKLINYFNELNLNNKWLMFSKGGVEKWEKNMSEKMLNNNLKTDLILDIQRFIVNQTQVKIHIQYPNSEDILSCETFRNRLKLPSCPERIKYNFNKKEWFFSGIGEGHGLGFNLELNKLKSEKGSLALELLKETKWN